MKIKLLVDGGSMKPGPIVGQKLGPLGVNIGKVIEEVNSATSSFKGMKVPVELDIDSKTKELKVNISSPPTSGLLKKELGLEKGSGEAGKTDIGNAAIEQIISVAKAKHVNLLSQDFKNTVKSVVGTCVSLGLLIENKHPNEVQKEIDEGHYDKEIEEQRTETSEEKRAKLDKFFEVRKTKQDAEAKRIEEEAAAAEAAKAEAAEAAEAEEGKEGEKKEEAEEGEKPAGTEEEQLEEKK